MVLPAGVQRIGSFKGDKGDTGTFAAASAESVAADQPAQAILGGTPSARTVHFKVPRGIPGVNAVESDEAMATYLGTEGTQTRGAADQVVGHTARTDGAQMRKAADNVARTVALTGHSLLYGQDTSATGTTNPTNGASQKRSSMPTTVAFETQAATASASTLVLVNQTYPGDRTSEALSRWAAGSSGDLEFFWLDTNDARNYGGFPDGVLSDAQTSRNIKALAQRARQRGASFVVVGGAPVNNARNSQSIFASAETERTVTERLGGVYVDVGEILGDNPAMLSLWTDGVHLTARAYEQIGARLAGLLGAKGVHPPRVTPGRVFTWLDQVFVGGSIAGTSAPTVAGSVLRIDIGASASLSFWADAPVRPIVTLRAGENAIVKVSGAGDLNHPPVIQTVRVGTYADATVIVGPPTLTPGPSVLTVTSLAGGRVDLLSVRFVPVAQSTLSTSSLFDADAGGVLLAPVGGKSRRKNNLWDTRLALELARPLYSGEQQTTGVSRTWIFDLRVGVASCGVVLTDDTFSTKEGDPFRARWGWFLFREGDKLRVRRMDNGSVTSTDDIAGVFPATGTVSAFFEVEWTGADLRIHVDGVLRWTITAPTAKAIIPGIIAGGSTAFAYAAGSAIVR